VLKRLLSAAVAALIALPASGAGATSSGGRLGTSGARELAARATTAIPSVYLVGADVQSINPTPAMIATKSFFLGGYGLSSGNIGNNLIPPPAALPNEVVTPRAAIGLLGNTDADGHGVHSRTFAIGDGSNVIEFAEIETQGYFNAYRQGPYGTEQIRNDAAAAIVAAHKGATITAAQILVNSVHTHGGPDTVGAWGGVPTTYLQLIHDRTVAALVNAYNQMQPAHVQFATAHAGVIGENVCSTQGAEDLPCYPADGDGDPLLTNQLAETSQNSGMDDEIRVLQARSVGNNSVIVTFVNYSSHPTVLGSDNLYVTADYPGVVSDLLTAHYGGIGFDQVATLGRTQPNRANCSNTAIKGRAMQRCILDEYAARVFARVKYALSTAPTGGRTNLLLSGKPTVGLSSYLLFDTSTNPLLNALMVGGAAGGAQIYRAINPPWFTGTEIGTDSYSGHIGDILISGGPGEMYPQIVATVRSTVPAAGYINVGTAGDFLGYIISPFGAYPNVVLATIEDGSDNLLFNDSQTLGERLTCSLLRGAGDTMNDNPMLYWSKVNLCAAFVTDYETPAGFDTSFPAQPNLSSVFTH
jgi:hypothetical protein